MTEIDKAKKRVEAVKDLEKASKKVEQVGKYIDKDITLNRDTNKNVRKFERYVKNQEAAQKALDKLK